MATTLTIDNISNIWIESIQETFANVIGSIVIPRGRTQYAKVGSDALNLSINGAVNELTASASAIKAKQLEELTSNVDRLFHYIQFPSNESKYDGWYVIDSLSFPRERAGLVVYKFSMQARRIADPSTHKLATQWSAAAETYSGWTGLTASSLVTLPYAATNSITTATGTRTSSDGSNQYLINPLQNVATYTPSTTIANWYLSEARVYDQATSLIYSNKLIATATSNLVGYWKLNEASGTTAYDYSGNARNGTLNGGAAPGSSGIGDGLTSTLFDGVNDYIELYSAGLASAISMTAGTLIVWAKALDSSFWTDGTAHGIVDFQSSGGSEMLLYKTSSNNNITAYRNGTTQAQTTSSVDWMCLMMTWDTGANQLKLYYNGTLAGTKTCSAWSGSTNYIKIGLGGSYFKGYIAHLAIWSTVLDATQAATLATV